MDTTKRSRKPILVKQMSMVLQDPFLFSGTVKRILDIIMTPPLTRTFIMPQSGRADEFISALDNGYDSVLAREG
ncbi:MAG: hypothetical protein CM1200mP35_04220 [Chloroflexota bacterium]|nr:MAG: hypothetical protein CM1200mP35_04220 [Chloroflexota bacterium]